VLDAQPGVDTDYVALVDPDTFEDVNSGGSAARQGVLAVAARVGATRLIDNESVEVTG
jgi:pantoate--beta-alanine ligase